MSDHQWSIQDDPVHRYTKPGDEAVIVPGLAYPVQLAENVPPYLFPGPMSEWGFERVIPSLEVIKTPPGGAQCTRVVVEGERRAILPAFLYR